MPPTTTKVPTATTPEDNDYCPQSGTYDRVYSGDMTERSNQEEFEQRDAKVDATRKEFGKGIPAGTGPGVTSGHDLD
jgi:hypothetical protein